MTARREAGLMERASRRMEWNDGGRKRAKRTGNEEGERWWKVEKVKEEEQTRERERGVIIKNSNRKCCVRMKNVMYCNSRLLIQRHEQY